jgi:signal transduction histidine kinase
MQNLIDALLRYSRINSIDLVMQYTDLNVVLKIVTDSIADDIKENQVTIEADVLPVLKIVPLQFDQLFLNIIGNSIKYRKPDVPPHIKITAEVVKSSIVYPTAVVTNYHKISLIDNGIGFEQKYADKVFELFQRLHDRQDVEGTGIGLAICKKIVQNHNGIIKVTSSPGKGTTFAIYLPVEER